MADSRRELIFKAVVTRFAGITVAGGYETNLGNGVKQWRVTDFKDDELPLLNLRDVECITDQKIGHHEHRLKIEAIAVSQLDVSDGVLGGRRARKMAADLHKAIGVDRKWGGLATDTNPIRDIVLIEQDKVTLASVKFEFEIVYRTGAYDPYPA